MKSRGRQHKSFRGRNYDTEAEERERWRNDFRPGFYSIKVICINSYSTKLKSMKFSRADLLTSCLDVKVHLK